VVAIPSGFETEENVIESGEEDGEGAGASLEFAIVVAI